MISDPNPTHNRLIARDEIYAKVHENNKKLASCDRHEFTIPINPNNNQVLPKPAMFCWWRCAKCGGEVDPGARHWYEDGLKHGAPRHE